VATFTGATVDKDTHEVENIFWLPCKGVAEMIYVVITNVYRWRELEVVVYFPSTEVTKVKLEAFQVENQVVGNIFEAGPDSN